MYTVSEVQQDSLMGACAFLNNRGKTCFNWLPTNVYSFQIRQEKHTGTTNYCKVLLHPKEIPYNHAVCTSASHLGMRLCLE